MGLNMNWPSNLNMGGNSMEIWDMYNQALMGCSPVGLAFESIYPLVNELTTQDMEMMKRCYFSWKRFFQPLWQGHQGLCLFFRRGSIWENVWLSCIQQKNKGHA